MSLIEKLPKVAGIYRENASLKSWFDVGGKAEILYKPKDAKDLSNFLQNCPKEIPINILGIGSNIIIHDEGVKGVVIRLGKEFADISVSENKITVGAAALCANCANQAANQGIGDLEFLSGIPGSIGGAVAMNAGCYGFDVAQVLEFVKAIDYDGNLINITKSQFSFDYRHNSLAKNYIFISATFVGTISKVEIVQEKIKNLQKNRQESQPIRAKTGGSTFKNPESCDKKAWQLIDEVGYRGKIKGGAKISEKHCNFLINFDNAKATDLLELGNEVKAIVKDKTGIDLQWEIKILK